MRTIADHVYDIANNSIHADAKNIEIALLIERNTFTFSIKDDGKGIPEEMLVKIFDPFVTGRDKKIRKVGLGLPFLKQNAEITGGRVAISSVVGRGTVLEAVFNTDNIDMVPLGDMASTISGLFGVKEGIEFKFMFTKDEETESICTSEIKEVLGDDIPLGSIKVLPLLKDIIDEILQGINFAY